MRLILPGSFGLGLGLLLFSALGFSLWGFSLALAFGALGGLGVYVWQVRLEREGPGPLALERIALKEAWRRGGVLHPKDLGPYMSEEKAQAVLETLRNRGLCQKEGEGYRF